MRILMCTYIRIVTQLRNATCIVLMHRCMKQLLLTSLPAVLNGLDCVLGCGPGDGPGEVGAVLAESGSEREIQGSESVYSHSFQ